MLVDRINLFFSPTGLFEYLFYEVHILVYCSDYATLYRYKFCIMRDNRPGSPSFYLMYQQHTVLFEL